jgi:hypothetical protein
VDQDLRQEIGRLRQSQVKELRLQYRELFGEESRSGNRMHLFRRVAWRLQARGAGELSQQARQRAEQLADDAALRVRAPREFWRLIEQQPSGRRDPRLPATGSELKRTYRGQTIVVRVEENGFTFNEQRFASLSAIAYQVTGTRWNGYLFLPFPGRPNFAANRPCDCSSLKAWVGLRSPSPKISLTAILVLSYRMVRGTPEK